MSHTRIWQLAWPVILSNITIPLLGMVDIAMVGHANHPHLLAAIANGSMIFDVLFWGFGFLRMSTTGLVAQSPNDSNILVRALLIAFTLACLLLLFQRPIFSLVCFFLKPSHTLLAPLGDYFFLRLYAAPATLANYVLLGYFFGRQNTIIPLFLLVLTNVTAITFDVLFVKQWQWGIEGLAYANIIAQTLGACIGLWLLNQYYHPYKALDKTLFSTERFLALFHLNKDIFIRTLCLMTTLGLFTQQGNRLGTTVVAANAVVLSLHLFMSYGLDGFAIACESLVGQALSQKNNLQLRLTIKRCAEFSFIVATCFSVLYALTASALFSLLSNQTQVINEAKQLIPWLVLLPILSAGSYLLDGVFIGATWSKPMRDTMLLATFFIFIPATTIFHSLANHGLWLSFCCFMLFRGLSLLIVLKQKLSAL